MIIPMIPQASADATATSNAVARKHMRNRNAAAEFIINGAHKRRKLAFTKAKMLQRELGVIVPLVSVK